MNIKKLRLAKGMTQSELSKAIGVTLRQVSAWETKGMPKIYSRLKKLERILLQ